MQTSSCTTQSISSLCLFVYFWVSFRQLVEESFLDMADEYEDMAKSRLYLDGSPMRDPFDKHEKTFNYAKILQHIHLLRARLQQKYHRD